MDIILNKKDGMIFKKIIIQYLYSAYPKALSALQINTGLNS